VRALAIDLGLKRTGLAWTDPTQRVALPLEVVPTHQLRARLEALAPEVAVFVLGYPRRLSGEPTDLTPHVEGLERWLRQRFPEKEVVRVDERFSTYEAARALQAIPKARRNKGAHDIASAVIILQAYLLRIRR
jgi:putative Holliday junction resolvase